MIGACDLLSRKESFVLDLFLCSLFSGESERSGDEPAVFVDKERMHAHLMEVSSIVEFSMIDQKGISVVVDQDRIMALGTLAACHAAPTCVGAHKLHATVGHRVVAVIEFVFAVDRADTLTIDERTVGVLAAEDTHHIARIRVQTSVREEEIVVVADMTDKRTLTRDIVSASYLLAEIRITGSVGIGIPTGCFFAIDLIGIGVGIVTQSRGIVKLQLPDTTRPRAVRHQQIALLVVEHARVDTVRPKRSPLVFCIVAGRQRRGTSSNRQVGMLPVTALGKIVVVVASLKA